MSDELDDMKVVQDAVVGDLGLPKAPARKFSKMTAALFEEAAPRFTVSPHQGGAEVSADQVGRTVQLRAFIVKEGEGAYRPKIEVWDQAEVQLGELEGDQTQLTILAIQMEYCIAFLDGVDPLEVRVDRIPGSEDRTASDLRYEIWYLYQAWHHIRSSMRFKTLKTYLKKFPERSGAFGIEVDSSLLPKPQPAQEKKEAPQSAFAPYRKVIKKRVFAEGLAVPITYMPTRSLNQLQKYIDQGVRIAPSENLQEDDWADWNKEPSIFFDDAPPFGVSEDLLATREKSALRLTDMMRVLALLTDDEMLSRVVAMAPRRKDGGLADSRLAISVAMDGIFEDGTYYCVNAKSGSKSGGLSRPSGSIEITMQRKVQPWQEKHAGGAARFLEEHADIVARMGI